MVLSRDNVRVISAAGDVEIVGADIIAKLSAETSESRPVAAWDQRIVMSRVLQYVAQVELVFVWNLNLIDSAIWPKVYHVRCFVRTVE